MRVSPVDRKKRKSSYADTTNSAHGEMLGEEARRINALVGFKLMSAPRCPAYAVLSGEQSRRSCWNACSLLPYYAATKAAFTICLRSSISELPRITRLASRWNAVRQNAQTRLISP